MFQRDIASTDQVIDILVYHHYAHTPDEISIVEGQEDRISLNFRINPKEG